MRGRGLGRQLMGAAMDAAENRECRLVATADGLPLYEKLGFAACGEVLQHQGIPAATDRPEGVTWAEAIDPAELAALDAQAFGADRTALFTVLAERARFALVRDQGVIKGFAALRAFGRGEVIGPVVAENAEIAKELIAFVFSERPGAFLRVDTTADTGLAPGLPNAVLAMSAAASPCAGRKPKSPPTKTENIRIDQPGAGLNPERPMLSNSLIELDRAHLVHPVSSFRGHEKLGVRVLQSAHGATVTDMTGHQLIDGFAGLWCVNAGYGHDSIVEAAAKQMRELPYATAYFDIGSEPAIRLASELADRAPGDLNHVYFTLGGSDAVDSTIRFIRYYWHAKGQPQRDQFISIEQGYHGSTTAGSGLTALPAFHAGFGVPYDWQHKIPSHYAYRNPVGSDPAAIIASSCKS